jgi:hypothetical protein
MKKPLFPEEKTTATFSDYFKLDASAEEVLEEFGFTFCLERCDLPRREVGKDLVDELVQRFDRTLPHVDLTNEAARREVLISPVVTEVAVLTNAKIRIEYRSETLWRGLDRQRLAVRHPGPFRQEVHSGHQHLYCPQGSPRRPRVSCRDPHGVTGSEPSQDVGSLSRRISMISKPDLWTHF